MICLSKKPLNLSQVEQKICPGSLSTQSTSKTKKIPGHSFSSIQDSTNSTKTTQALVKSSCLEENTIASKKSLSYSGYTNLLQCIPVECSLKQMEQHQEDYSFLPGLKLFSEKGMKTPKIQTSGVMPGTIGLIPVDTKGNSAPPCGTSPKTIHKKIWNPEEPNGSNVSDSEQDSANNFSKVDRKKRKKNHHQRLVQKEQENQKDSVPVEKKAAPKVSPPKLTPLNTVIAREERSVVQKNKVKKRKISIAQQLTELKRVREEYSQTKGKDQKKALKAVLQNVQKRIQLLPVKENHSGDGIPYPEVSRMN